MIETIIVPITPVLHGDTSAIAALELVGTRAIGGTANFVVAGAAVVVAVTQPL
ncbi:hypothetical protein MQA28_26285 [Escherichia coli]|nr:hypothetical protein [Escherichia coli]